MEISKTTLGTLLVVMIVLSSGITFYVKDAGTKTGCRAGWEAYPSGEFEGYYKCTTSAGIRTDLCFEVFDSANTQNYWCQQGALAEDTKEEIIIQEVISKKITVKANGGTFSCDTPDGFVHTYTRCLKDNGAEGYLGELI